MSETSHLKTCIWGNFRIRVRRRESENRIKRSHATGRNTTSVRMITSLIRLEISLFHGLARCESLTQTRTHRPRLNA